MQISPCLSIYPPLPLPGKVLLITNLVGELRPFTPSKRDSLSASLPSGIHHPLCMGNQQNNAGNRPRQKTNASPQPRQLICSRASVASRHLERRRDRKVDREDRRRRASGPCKPKGLDHETKQPFPFGRSSRFSFSGARRPRYRLTGFSAFSIP